MVIGVLTKSPEVNFNTIVNKHLPYNQLFKWPTHWLELLSLSGVRRLVTKKIYLPHSYGYFLVPGIYCYDFHQLQAKNDSLSRKVRPATAEHYEYSGVASNQMVESC